MEKASSSQCIHSLDCCDFLPRLNSVDCCQDEPVRTNCKLLQCRRRVRPVTRTMLREHLQNVGTGRYDSISVHPFPAPAACPRSQRASEALINIEKITAAPVCFFRSNTYEL